MNANTSDTVPSRRSRMRKLIATAIAGAAIITGSIAGVAAPAEAAPAATAVRSAALSSGTASVCFKSAIIIGGVRYGYGPFNRTVSVDVLSNGTWYQYHQTTPGINGCLTINLYAGWTYRFRVYHNEANRWFIGQTGGAYLSPGGYLNYGTLYV
ncbi:hypothetical protein ASF62_02660 [Leifsonia sp. Leaf325]|nr:hypothetical protein [Leifsonia sp. Leaf325]KQQ95446.1 hypothetical protein ASF62_02660 [Leifsonia sp. Leaf325]